MRHGFALAAVLISLGAATTSLAAGATPGARSASSASSSLEDPEAPGLIPELSGFATPVLAPGESGVLSFTIANRYLAPIRKITLTIEVYRYATIGSSVPVTADYPSAPLLCFEGRPPPGCATELGIGGNPDLTGRADKEHSRLGIRFEVHASASTPHGSLLDPATYFLRTTLDYVYVLVGPSGTTEVPYRLISRGHVTDADWQAATAGSGVNISYIKKFYSVPGRPVIGLIPDTSISVRETMPSWPLWLLVGLAVLFGSLGVMFHLNEEKGWFPWLPAGFQRMKGKARVRHAALVKRKRTSR